MPSGADLFELFFMGPGLLCLPFALLLPIMAVRRLVRRGRSRRQTQRLDRAKDLIGSGQTEAGLVMLAREVDRLRQTRRTPVVATVLVDLLGYFSSEVLAAGHTSAALAAATEAEQLSAAHHPNTMRHAQSLYLLGRALARLGRDTQALTYLQQAVVVGETADDGTDAALIARAMFATNTSMVLRRLGDTPTALVMATQAVHLDGRVQEIPAAYMRAGRAWALAALALAQADSGLDGRPAADIAVQIFGELDHDQIMVAGEGLAFASYAAAYARHRQSDCGALDLARDAVARFAGIARAGDALQTRRRADAEDLLAEILARPPATAAPDTLQEDLR